MVARQCRSIEHFSQRPLWDYRIVQYSRGRTQVSAPKPKSVSSGPGTIQPWSLVPSQPWRIGERSWGTLSGSSLVKHIMYNVIYTYTSSCGVYCDIRHFQTTKSDTSRWWCNTLKSLAIDYVNSVIILDTLGIWACHWWLGDWLCSFWLCGATSSMRSSMSAVVVLYI